MKPDVGKMNSIVILSTEGAKPSCLPKLGELWGRSPISGESHASRSRKLGSSQSLFVDGFIPSISHVDCSKRIGIPWRLAGPGKSCFESKMCPMPWNHASEWNTGYKKSQDIHRRQEGWLCDPWICRKIIYMDKDFKRGYAAGQGIIQRGKSNN